MEAFKLFQLYRKNQNNKIDNKTLIILKQDIFLSLYKPQCNQAQQNNFLSVISLSKEKVLLLISCIYNCKMKKKYPIQQDDHQIMQGNNKSRLIEQNRKLYSEISNLQSKVSAVLTKNIDYRFQQNDQKQKLSAQHKELTETQTTQIKKLKNKILLIKNAEKPQERQHIRQALDELVYLKGEKQKYEFQKQALLRKNKLKKQGLKLNIPLEEQQKKIISLFKAIQRQNFEIKNKSLIIQKEINNLHKVKELSKTSFPKSTQNIQFQVKRIDHEIIKIRAQIKDIEKQWHPQIDSLNTEYFILKDVKEEKQKQFDEIEKNLNTVKNRTLAMKQVTEILKDKARVSQVVISPKKRQEISHIYETERQQRQYFEQFRYKSNFEAIKLYSSKAQKSQKKLTKSREKIFLNDPSKTEPVKIFQTQVIEVNSSQLTKKIDTNSLEFNEFSVQKSHAQQIKLSPIKQLASVAVGTTFYYNEQEQEALNMH